MTEERVIPGGTPTWVRDATANDSDKSFTVPVGKMWDLKSIVSQIGCTATVGNRMLVITITDGVNPIHVPTTTGAITASQYGGNRIYFGGATAPNTTVYLRLDNVGSNLSVASTQGFPSVMLLAGYTIRVYDSSATDPAADDLTVILHYIEYDA